MTTDESKPKLKFELIKLPPFGGPHPPLDENFVPFEWPTKEYLDSLELREPLKLHQMTSKGVLAGSLSHL